MPLCAADLVVLGIRYTNSLARNVHDEARVHELSYKPAAVTYTQRCNKGTLPAMIHQAVCTTCIMTGV